MKMGTVSILMFLGFLTVSCAIDPIREAYDKSHQALDYCSELRKSGRLHSHREAAKCADTKILHYYMKAKYPYMDLIYLYIAANEAGADLVDKGQITDTQFHLQRAELESRIASEDRKRQMEDQEAQAQSMQGIGVLLFGLSAFQSVNAPPTTTCTSMGNTTTCR